MTGVRSSQFEPTPTEIRVLRILAEGFTHEEVGRQLGMGRHTARDHSKSIRKKLGARNTANAVAIGLRSGLL